MSEFDIALDITENFSQCETSGGQGKLAIFTRGPMTTDPTTGHRMPGPMVAVPGIRGNTAPLRAKDLRDDVSGELREGDIQVFTIEPIDVASNLTQGTSMFVLRGGEYFKLVTRDDLEYAKGNHYFALRDRGESGV